MTPNQKMRIAWRIMKACEVEKCRNDDGTVIGYAPRRGTGWLYFWLLDWANGWLFLVRTYRKATDGG